MKAFNLYFKILKKTIVVIIVNIVIFLFIAFMFTAPSSEPTDEFCETKISVSFINLDEDSILINQLKSYLSKYVFYREIKEKDIADALYFREIYLSFVVPENFTEDLLQGKKVKISQESTPDNIVNYSINRAINKYLTLVLTFHEETNLELDDILIEVDKVLSTNVDAKNEIIYINQISSVGYFYNYAAYLLFAVLITIVGFINIKIRRNEVKNRIVFSPYSQTKFSLEIIFGNFIFTFIFTLLIVGLSFILYPMAMNSKNGFFLILNTFCMAVTTLSISYFISLLTKSEQVIAAVSNVFSLGTSFLCGAFVPQMLLSSGILKVGMAFPTYYFVYNNDSIVQINNFTGPNIYRLFLYMGIQLLFGFIFIILSIIVNKKQMQNNS